MQDVARRMRVRLDHEGSGLKFVEAVPAAESEVKPVGEPVQYLSPGEEQRYSLLVSDAGRLVGNHRSRPLSWMSQRSVSPISHQARDGRSED